MKNTQNIHANHRQRMRERFLKIGMAGFLPHEIMEMLLFYSCPRIDTNTLGHALIDRFGDVKGVLDADPSELVRVDGIGENSATLIKFVKELAKCYITDNESSKSFAYDSPEALRGLFVNHFMGEKDERLLVACFGKKLNLLGCESVCEGSISAVCVNIRKIAEAAIRYNSDVIALGHNHPNSTAAPSGDDIKSTNMIISALEPLGIQVIDHIITSGSSSVSLRDSGYISLF